VGRRAEALARLNDDSTPWRYANEEGRSYSGDTSFLRGHAGAEASAARRQQKAKDKRGRK
jgi:hypothetical protein